METEAQVIFPNPFTICSSGKLKFFVGLFVDEETSESYPFANRLNGIIRIAHLWFLHIFEI
jgi:hypothetical protein